MFYWKRFHVSNDNINFIQDLYKSNIPTNNHFFQELNIGVTHFIGLEVQKFVLIQVAPNAIGRIHTDWRPTDFGYQLALQIPLENCEKSITNIWESDFDPPLQYTENKSPYKYFEPKRCRLITSFNLTEPTFFRTDIPHSVDNPTENIRRAISIRFKEDPWHLINE